ncbi:hypothetical protein PRIC1_009542 [Phytophthora ramorum]
MTKRNSDGGPTTARKRRRLTSASVDGAAIPANAYGGVLQFRHAWKNLRKAGWTSKPPSGGQSLDCRYRYIRPCGNPRGVEGEDYLLGEDAVLRYVETQAIQTGDSAGAHGHGRGRGGGREGGAAAVRGSGVGESALAGDDDVVLVQAPEGRAMNGKAASTTPLDATSRSVGGGATPVAQDAGDAGARGRGRGRGHGRGRGRGGAAVAAALALAASDSDESLLLDSADDDVVLVGGPYIMDYPPFDR